MSRLVYIKEDYILSFQDHMSLIILKKLAKRDE